MKVYYVGFRPGLDRQLRGLAERCGGVWRGMTYDYTSQLREMQFHFGTEDDEDGFREEVLELDAGVSLDNPASN